MSSSRSLVLGSLLVGLVGSISGRALAEPPHEAPKVEAAPAKAPTAPRVVARPATAPQAAHETTAATTSHTAPVAVVLPSAAKAAAPAKPITISSRSSAGDKAAPEAPRMNLEPQSSDPGIKISADPSGNRILVKGTAQGPAVKYLEGIYFENGKRIRPVDYEVARGVSFQIDHSAMPDFSKDKDYTNKNKWYFSHLAETGTEKGQSAMTVASHLAASLEKGGAYKATVTETEEGASITLEAR